MTDAEMLEEIRSITGPGIYRGWSITGGTLSDPLWSAKGPTYEAWTEGEGEWQDNGEKASAETYQALTAEIDAWYEENE